MIRALLFILLLAPQEEPNKNLKPMSWMIGTWTGSGEAEGIGKYKDEYRFGWTLKKNFIKSEYRMWVDGKIAWQDTSMIGWDKDKKKRVMTWIKLIDPSISFETIGNYFGVSRVHTGRIFREFYQLMKEETI